VHNPSSNLRLKSGIAPVTLLHEAKVPLALGLDSSTINDDSDMFQEMRLCANLQRMPGIGKQPIAAKAIFDMATRGGAHALGWDNSCGTLEPGKRADLILLDARRLMQPYLSSNHHPIDTLLYRAKASDVDTVMIDGEILYRGKKHQRPAARRAARELAGLVQPPGTTAADPLEAALFPHVLSYYQEWDDEDLTPYHQINAAE
jgi:cytosine/adenosine deaminase-related metal-dependent hydrolase